VPTQPQTQSSTNGNKATDKEKQLTDSNSAVEGEQDVGDDAGAYNSFSATTSKESDLVPKTTTSQQQAATTGENENIITGSTQDQIISNEPTTFSKNTATNEGISINLDAKTTAKLTSDSATADSSRNYNFSDSAIFLQILKPQHHRKHT